MSRHLPLLLALLTLGTSAHAQLSRKINIRARDQDLSRVLQSICTIAKLNLIVGPELKGKKISLDLKQIPTGQLLDYLAKLNGFGLAVTPDGSTVLAGSQANIAALNMSEARVHQLANADAEKMAGILRSVYKDKMEVISDPHTNSVILVPTGR